MEFALVLLIKQSHEESCGIRSLEAEKDSLTKSNKAMKKVMWDWKQQLFAEASSISPLVALSNPQAIYGESPIPSTGHAEKEGVKSSPTKIVV